MKNEDIIATLESAIELIDEKIERAADIHYSHVILDSSYRGDYVRAYKERGWCRDEEETITNLRKIIDGLEDG